MRNQGLCWHFFSYWKTSEIFSTCWIQYVAHVWLENKMVKLGFLFTLLRLEVYKFSPEPWVRQSYQDKNVFVLATIFGVPTAKDFCWLGKKNTMKHLTWHLQFFVCCHLKAHLTELTGISVLCLMAGYVHTNIKSSVPHTNGWQLTHGFSLRPLPSCFPATPRRHGWLQ